MEDIKQEIGSRIKELRKSQKISREELAEQTGLHFNMIGFIERGETNTGFENLYKICAVLNITMTDLFKGY